MCSPSLFCSFNVLDYWVQEYSKWWQRGRYRYTRGEYKSTISFPFRFETSFVNPVKLHPYVWSFPEIIRVRVSTYWDFLSSLPCRRVTWSSLRGPVSETHLSPSSSLYRFEYPLTFTQPTNESPDLPLSHFLFLIPPDPFSLCLHLYFTFLEVLLETYGTIADGTFSVKDQFTCLTKPVHYSLSGKSN